MAEFVCHKERSYYYKKNKQVLGHAIYWANMEHMMGVSLHQNIH